jgi:hypothetical protein
MAASGRLADQLALELANDGKQRKVGLSPSQVPQRAIPWLSG